MIHVAKPPTKLPDGVVEPKPPPWPPDDPPSYFDIFNEFI